MALAQGDQAACVEIVVRPALMIAPTPAPFAPMALAQDASETSAHVSVHAREHVLVAVLEVSIPAHQRAIEVLADLAQTAPLGASRLAADRILELVHALLTRPFLAPLEVIAKEVEATALTRVDDPGFVRVEF